MRHVSPKGFPSRLSTEVQVFPVVKCTSMRVVGRAWRLLPIPTNCGRSPRLRVEVGVPLRTAPSQHANAGGADRIFRVARAVAVSEDDARELRARGG